MVEVLVGLYLGLLALVIFVWVGIGLLAVACSNWPWLSHWLPLPEGFGERRDDPQARIDYSLPAQAAERTYRPTIAIIISAVDKAVDHAELGALIAGFQYPADRREIHVIAPGPVDRLRAALAHVPNLVLHDSGGSRRRDVLLNRVVPLTSAEILVFVDSRAALAPEAIRLLVRHFAHPRVACVAAERRLCEGSNPTTLRSRLRCFDARMWTISGPFSEVFAMRASFFEPTESDPLVEDFRIAVRLASKDARAVRETGALVAVGRLSIPSAISLCTARLRAVLRPGVLWRFGRYGLAGCSHWSHRVLRYVVAPLAFFVAIPLGAVLAVWYPWLWIPVALHLFLVVRAVGFGMTRSEQPVRGAWVLQFVGTAGAALAGMAILVVGRTSS